MTPRFRRIVMMCGLVPTVAVAVLSLYRPAALASLDFGVYDTLSRALPTHVPSDRIVIVDVDERSLATVGQWPWRRDVMGRLIDRLRDDGASVVALDVVFAERDRYEGKEVNPDDALAVTLRKGRVVLGYAMTFDGTHHAPRTCVRHPLGVAVVHPADDQSGDPFFHATGAVCNLESLSEAAGVSGFLNAAPDSDGILRRVPLLVEFDGRVFPALSLAAVSTFTGAKPVAVRISNVNSSTLVLTGNRTVTLDGKGNLLLRYRGPKRTFQYASAADVLEGKIKPETFTRKIVFIGTTALGTREVVSTPIDTLFAGVEVHATAADNLLQQDLIRRPEFGVALETQIVLCLGVLSALLFLRFGLYWGGSIAALCGAMVWGSAFWTMASDGTALSPLYPTLGLLSALGAMTIAGFTLERRRADQAGVDNDTSRRLMVQTLLSLTGIRDFETGRHSVRTQRYTRILAEELAKHPSYHEYLTPERVELLASLAPLHDIGKVGVPDAVLNKAGGLTPEELAEMRKHPAHGRAVIENAERAAGVRDDFTLRIAKDIVYTHHEKWDGSGYPQGLHGAAIPIPGRVMAVVDVYDAITSARLYHKPMTQQEATAFILKGRGTHFDPAVVDAFVRVSPILQHLGHEGDAAPAAATTST
jgi:HD-GYP domain-containing protein (c-di-GMP phosphodiesterase class II)